MPNSYYNHSTYPAPNTPASSAQLRSELDLITAGFNKLPTLAGNANKLIVVNATGTGLSAVAAAAGLAITGSTIDSTPIGATVASTGKFTDLLVTTSANLGSAVTISGGTINATPIGGTTRSTGAFTTVSATSGFTGNLTGNVTGNVTGSVTGNVTGNLTGNVTASSGTSTFNNVVINGSLDMDAGSTATIINLSNPTNAGDAANKGYVDTQDALRLALAGGTMSGAIAMGTNRITGLGDPTNAQDAATKNYVDTVAQGLDVKASVRVATTANIVLTGTQTIDGIAVVANDRVLVKDQSTAANNGIYLVAAGSWTRTTDADAWTELPGAFVFVEQGTTNDNSGWVCTVSAGGTLGTTAVTFEQFSGAGQITAGAGLTKTGNTLNVGTASSARIVVNSDNIDLATTGVTANTYAGIAVDTYGRVTSAATLTTISGYGITDAYTKTQIDITVSGLLAKTGGTMSGAIAMGTNKITGMADPTANQDAATKFYVDSILGSATSAAASASAAATSATNASNSATSASGSATSAAASATAAAASYDSFDDRYLGPKTADPTLDNDGNALLVGALYFNSVLGAMRVYTGSGWIDAAPQQAVKNEQFTATSGQTVFTVSGGYNPASVYVYKNGNLLKLADYTATDGSTVTLAAGATAGDIIRVVSYLSPVETISIKNAAAASAAAAAVSETNAGNSASAAATSATNAGNSATSAATSATNAGNSATAAAISATNAGNSATAAATSATNAANSATASAASATISSNAATISVTNATMGYNIGTNFDLGTLAVGAGVFPDESALVLLSMAKGDSSYNYGNI